MKKILLFVVFLLVSLGSFSQTPVVVNPTIPNPRPYLSPEEILKGWLRDFNHLKTKEAQQKPSGLKQRMIAYSARTYLQGNLFGSDSMKFTYSGYRGSSPAALTGNVTMVSLYDSFYHVPTDDPMLLSTQVYSASYRYNDNNDLISLRGYDSSRNLVEEKRLDYFVDHSLQSIEIIRYNSSSQIIRQTFYNELGKQVRDSILQIYFTTGWPNDSTYYVSNVYFDSLGRVDYTDSVYRVMSTSSSYDIATRISNFYDMAGAPYPASDSIISIRHDYLSGTNDTVRFQVDYYQYNSLNKLIMATYYVRDWGGGLNPPQLQPQSRYLYTYNSDGEIRTLNMQQPSGSNWMNAIREEYEYENHINTSYIQYSGDSFAELFKRISVLNENDVVDSVKTYQQGIYSSLYTVSLNAFGNLANERYFDLSSAFYNNFSYYYDEFDDPTAISGTNISGLELGLFPNPAGNSFQYQIGGKQPGSWQIAILDLSGRTLYKTWSEGNTGTIDISAFQPGIYVFSVLNPKDGKTGRIKFVKQ